MSQKLSSRSHILARENVLLVYKALTLRGNVHVLKLLKQALLENGFSELVEKEKKKVYPSSLAVDLAKDWEFIC